MKVFLFASGFREEQLQILQRLSRFFFFPGKNVIFSFCMDVMSNLDKRRLNLCYSNSQLELMMSVQEEYSILKQHYLSSHVVLSSLMATITHLSQEGIFSALSIDHQSSLPAALMSAKMACCSPLYGSMSKMSLIAGYSLHLVGVKQFIPYWMSHTITWHLLDFYNILYRCQVSGELYILNSH